MEVTGKTCPYCGSMIAEGEEAVFCSVCEMPHHMECWRENHGCTTFGCPGAVVAANQAQAMEQGEPGGQASPGRPCPKCGFSVPTGVPFCRKCGTRTPEAIQPAPEPEHMPPLEIVIEEEPPAMALPAQAPAPIAAAPRENPCPKCGFLMPGDSKFCRMCGSPMQPARPLEKYCARCGTKVDGAAAFCKRCGARLPELPA